MMHPLRGIVRRLLALAALVLSCTTPLAAQRTLEIRDFAAELLVRQNGSLRVKESITVDFRGEWNGIYRLVPLENRTRQGFGYTLQLRVTGVHDDAGRELRHELARKGGDLEIKVWVPGARDATRTVVLEYTVANAIRFSDQHDELYWNVTGDRWAYPIRAASADVYLPAEVSGIRTNVFTGAYGSVQQDADVEQVGTLARFRTRSGLGIYEGLTVAVAWNPGVVQRPTALGRLLGFLRSNLLLLAPLLALLVMLQLWRRYGRDPQLGAIAPQYEPPREMSPAEAGTLIDLRVDMRDVSATLVDLAVRGFVRVEESQDEHLFGLVKTRDYDFVLLRPRGEFGTLKEHERDLLESLFESDERVSLSSLQNRFYKKLPGITDSLKRSLVAGGYYVHNPNAVRALFALAGAIVGAAVYALGAWSAARYGTSPVTGPAAAVLTAIVVAVIGWQMPARTVRGTQTLRHLLGFEEFLERVEGDRFERVVDRPELFEKYLPFAMAFGVEKRWAAAFEGICSTPPDWYRSRHGGPFRTSLFVADVGRLSTATASTMRSAPRSSSGSSGFGGGGFSGGGFGGGGGGGF